MTEQEARDASKTRNLSVLLVAALTFGGAGEGVNGDIKRLSQEAFVFGYPLVLMDVTRRVMTATPNPTATKSPANQFLHLRTFPDHTFTDVVSPNADTLYSMAWLDFSEGPLVLSLPSMGKRYYLMPMLDGWTNVIADPGTRTNGGAKSSYAITPPGWKGTIPKGVQEIRSPTALVWIVGRTQTNGRGDYAAVSEIQDRYELTPLSSGSRGKGYAPRRDVPADPAVDTRTPPIRQVANMDAGTFFDTLAALMKANPPAAGDAPMVEKLARIGVKPGEPFDIRRLDPAVAKGIAEGARAALDAIVVAAHSPSNLRNGWRLSRKNGEWGTDYMRRAMIAWIGLGTNLEQDAVYPRTRVDSEGQPFDGTHKYVLHFDKGETPPCRAFWSLTIYDEKQRFVENPIRRYAIGDRDELKYNPDGSLDLFIQRESPGTDKEPNWLPAPADSFNLMLRIFWPKAEVFDNTWVPPGVTRLR